MIKLLSCIFFFTFQNPHNCEEQYLDKIVKTSTMHSYYLIVSVKSGASGERKMIIQRNDFFHVLSFDRTFIKQSNKTEYVKTLILKNHVFKIKNQSLIKKYFLPLATPDDRVDSLCLLGKDQFLNAVFNSKGLQKDTTYDIGYTIQKLVELKVPVLFYGESSRLYIDRTYNCKQD